ncbi:MAG: 4Fe-4S double cluster binding domain-containing protein [Acholeplasma sp.]|jgi:epoxyqueuosine reductase|nr:4Fe-4S double cluster binding domain-containing protein [Acholeplasma sp.]
MNTKNLWTIFQSKFDLVGIIRTKDYLEAARQMGKNVIQETYPTMVVLGLSYPKRTLKHTHTHLVPSFYTFGKDYHLVLKDRMMSVLNDLGIEYKLGVDNHNHDERLAATLAGLGFFGKNQLIINETYGSYFFLGLVFLNIDIETELKLTVNDDCGTCRKCIDACPTNALSEQGYRMDLCMSHYNQSKRILTDIEMDANYSLFGCDICQMVCPKNIQIVKQTHPEFELSGKEMVSIVDLFTDSEKTFKDKYKDMPYLWKGKTVLMRNALLIIKRLNMKEHIDLIASGPDKSSILWYQDTLDRVLKALKED